MAKKVYCGKCRWYQSAGVGDEAQNEGCNAILGRTYSYSAGDIVQREYRRPSELNENNDCKRYSWNWFGWRLY